MFSLCRLCATCIDPTELTTDMSALESKLTFCCGWKPSENEARMPKKVCCLCLDQLQRSWDFVQSILAAEEQLNKLLSEPMQTNSEEIPPQNEDLKEEEDTNEYIGILNSDEIKPSFDVGNNGSDDDIDNRINEFSDDGTFGEPIDYSDDESTHSKEDLPKKPGRKFIEKQKSIKKPFLTTLDVEDCLDGGSITSNGVAKLEKLYPDMKTMSWNDLKYKCVKCNRIFEGQHHYYAHTRSSHLQEISTIKIPCSYCKSNFQREQALNRHIAATHFVHLKYRCTCCKDYYWNTRELTKHQNMHTDIEYKCEICGHISMNRDSFYAHCTTHYIKKIKNTDERFICDICKKSFKTKDSIRNHMILHTDRFDHICEICGWKFQYKGNLKAHLASAHMNLKPFKCEQCNKCFKTKHHLKSHSYTHDENYKPHQCPTCGTKFRETKTLTVHMRSHTKIYPYTCKFCGKGLRHSHTLKNHERTHNNVKPYACTQCQYRCTSKGNLNKHMLRLHSIDFRNHIIQQNS